MPSTHFLPIFVLCPHFCNWAHCHLVEIFTSWIWIGLVTVRTHLESRLSGSMGRVISLCYISPSAYFCLHRWCAASSVSAVRHCQHPPPSPPPLPRSLLPPAAEGLAPSPSPWPSAVPPLSAGDRKQGTTGMHNGRGGGRISLEPIKSSIINASELYFSSMGFSWEGYHYLIQEEAASNMQGTE